jgi:hypothetical protein
MDLSIAPPKTRIEIFRSPAFFDDNFLSGWTLISGGTSSITKDGDVMAVKAGNMTYGQARKILPSISTNANPKIAVRVLATSDPWTLKVYDGVGWHTIFENLSTTGLHEATLPSGETLTFVDLFAEGTGKTARFDYLEIGKYAVLVPPAGDQIGELTADLPLFNDGINQALFLLDDGEAAYSVTTPIKRNDLCIIYVTRTPADLGDSLTKMMGGKIVSAQTIASDYGDFAVQVEVEGHAEEALAPQSLLSAHYASTNGRTIIEAALALCTRIGRSPYDDQWFDAGGSAESTDDRIYSTHSIEVDEVLPGKIVREILSKASNPAGVPGFVITETPSGMLLGYLRNSLDSRCAVTLYPERYKRKDDMHRVRNRKTVYGAVSEALTYPLNPDLWTLDASGNWTAVNGTISSNTTTPKVGSDCLRCTSDGSFICRFRRAFSPALDVARHDGFRKFGFWGRRDVLLASQKIRILAPDTDNYFEATFPDPGSAGVWAWWSADLGIENTVSDDLPSAIWTAHGSPSWNNMQGVEWWVTSGATLIFDVDAPRFFNGRVRYTKDDTASQAEFGLRTAESEVDDSLETSAECQAKAEADILGLKSSLESIENLKADGNLDYAPGKILRLLLTHEDLDIWRTLLHVKHSVSDNTWDVILTLGEEAPMQDQLYRQMQQHIALLKRVREIRSG